MTPDQERETVRRARDVLASWWRSGRSDFRLVEVQLEGEPDRSEIVLTFTHRDRPDCLVGYRWALHGIDPADPDANDPDSQATVLWANLLEDIHDARDRLPSDCRPGGVLWLP